ncbi:hypothetical protein NPIL_535911 [Nephila pilipes]|uniref:Uncharacterized protein n=1 Tax=Nephila pilipes TaxID=299642 RepID=A0A8X6TKE0_NEPPI|nr:hypothetical protein NPIL_535911 [Nephila pilipes]
MLDTFPSVPSVPGGNSTSRERTRLDKRDGTSRGEKKPGAEKRGQPRKHEGGRTTDDVFFNPTESFDSTCFCYVSLTILEISKSLLNVAIIIFRFEHHTDHQS